MPRSTTTEQTLPAVVLAAGQSERFGEANKLLMPINARPLLTYPVEACCQARWVHPVLVALGHEADRVKAALKAHADPNDLSIQVNMSWQDGLSTTMQTAIHALPDNASGVLIVPGDMPLITPQLIDRVAETGLGTDRISFPTLNHRKGHPTAIPRRYFRQLLQTRGDIGAREIVREHWAETCRLELDLDEAHTQLDVDTDADRERVRLSAVAPSRIRLDNEPR